MPTATTRRQRITILLLAVWIAAVTAAPAAALTTEELLEEVQQRAFAYFWFEANPANGLVKDRSTGGSPCSIAATGFGLSAICIAIDRGYVTREMGRDRVMTTLETFWNGPQNNSPSGAMGYRGLFYHFLDMNTGVRVWNSELSSIDTALLIAGVLDAREYFDTDDPEDVALRDLADALYDRVDWEFMRNGGVALRMGWNPESGFASFGNWIGYNEAMIMYLLALGSDTYPVPASTWAYWTSGYSWQQQYGQEYVIFPPLFGHQYSHCWIDFRGIRDDYMQFRGIDYFENSRRATLAARQYCIANPFGYAGYSDTIWGLTASDDPWGYLAHGAPPAQNDNGTITPTAAVGSIPFAPEIVIPAMHAMYDGYGSSLWGSYGFRDAFNPSVNWFASDYLGIDQGPMIIMIENHLRESVWSRFMQNQNVQQGLDAANFVTVTSVESGPDVGGPIASLRSAPNPFQGATSIHFDLARATPVRLDVFDVRGRRVTALLEGERDAGSHVVSFDASGLTSGVYFCRLEAGGAIETRRLTVMK